MDGSIQPDDAEAVRRTQRQTQRVDRLKTVMSKTQDVEPKKSKLPRHLAILKELISDFGKWLAQPYNVDVEIPDSDDEENAPQAEAQDLPRKTWREKLHTVVVSNGFEATSCFLVIANLAFLGVQANCNGGCGTYTTAMLSTFDNFFTATFLLEWLLCVTAHGGSYFTTPETVMANMLDTFIVWVVGVFLLWVAPVLLNQEGLAALQAIRAIRAMRSLRSFKVLRHFQSFRMLLTGVLGTIPTLLACCLMMFLTVMTFGIISVDIIGRDEAWGLAASGTAAWYFQNGLIQASMTMSRFIFSDNAVDFIEELQEQQPYIWIYCFLFMAISAYVILNLVTAVICDKAQQIVNDNEAERLFEMRQEEKRNMKDLKRIFEVLDEDGSGLVTTEEFDAAFEIPECRDKFFLLGFDEEEMKQLFRVLDNDGEGELSVQEFLKGMVQVQGDCDSRSMLMATKSFEKVSMTYDKVKGSGGASVAPRMTQTQKSLEEWLTEIENLTTERLDQIERHLQNLESKADGFEKKTGHHRVLPPLAVEGEAAGS